MLFANEEQIFRNIQLIKFFNMIFDINVFLCQIKLRDSTNCIESIRRKRFIWSSKLIGKIIDISSCVTLDNLLTTH